MRDLYVSVRDEHVKEEVGTVHANSIVVIGGTGRLGEPVTRRLRADGYVVRVFTRSPEKARAKFGAECEIVVGDVEDQLSLDVALKGCHGVHINLDGGPDPDLERRGVENITRAAVKAGIQRISYLSGATVSEENCWFVGTHAKFHAEAAIRASGVPYSIFKPTFFMESLPSYVRGKRASVIGNQPHVWHWVAAADYARMVSSAYAASAAANKDFYVYGPQPYTLREALQKYCAIVHPEATVGNLPLWAASMLARLTRQKELEALLPFFRYTEKIGEKGDPTEANTLLGAPTTTLEQWCESQLRSSPICIKARTDSG